MMEFAPWIMALVLAQQLPLDWFDRVSNFGVLAVLMMFMCWGIVTAFRFLAQKLFADADPSKNFRGGLVVRWVDGQLAMMDEIRESVRKQVETSATFAQQMSVVMEAMSEVRQHVVVETNNVTLVPRGKKRATKTQIEKEGSDNDPDS